MTSDSRKGRKKTESMRQVRILVEPPRIHPRKRRRSEDVGELFVTVDFCGVSMLVPKPTKAQRRLRIAEGLSALAKLAKILAKPGVKLALSKKYPNYVADKRDPSLVVQTIGNVSRRGRFDVEGRFVEVK